MEKRRVLLIYGGRSAEHDVSRVSAVAVARALDPDRYEVIPVGITRDGTWVRSDSARAAIAAGPDALPDAFEVDGPPVVADAGGSRGAPGDVFDCDVVFPMVHGPFGEDGTLQGLCEIAGVPYVGSGVIGSAAAMDKVTAKRLFAAAGLPQARFATIRDDHSRDTTANEAIEALGFPLFVKPANMGSSVGVSKARDRGELDAALDLAFTYDEDAVIEEAIVGREIEVGILGDPPAASLPGEIVPAAEFYSYADKYEDGAASLLAPAPLTGPEANDVQRLALEAFAVCRCEGMARVDFFLEERAADGSAGRGFLVNEVNTIPGFTPISMYPRLWAESGVPYPALLDRLIDHAIERHARRLAPGAT